MNLYINFSESSQWRVEDAIKSLDATFENEDAQTSYRKGSLIFYVSENEEDYELENDGTYRLKAPNNHDRLFSWNIDGDTVSCDKFGKVTSSLASEKSNTPPRPKKVKWKKLQELE